MIKVLNWGAIWNHMLVATWIFKARSHLTLEFTRVPSQVGNRGCQLETVSSPPLSFDLHRIQKIGNSYLKICIFHHPMKVGNAGNTRPTSCLAAPVTPADEAEAGTGPHLHSTGSVWAVWPQSLWDPLRSISHSPRDGRRRDPGNHLTRA